MVQFVMTSTFSPRVERTNMTILRTTSPFIAFSGQAEYFSCIPLICSQIVRRCQTSTSTQMLLWLTDPLCRVVSGQVYPGTLTHLTLELPHEICLGSSKFAVHSFQGFVPFRIFHVSKQTAPCTPHQSSKNKLHTSTVGCVHQVPITNRVGLMCYGHG